MNVFTEIEPCRDAVWKARRAGTTFGLVPTMGSLHVGHLSLIRAATQRCTATAVTIFVNPTQFGRNEDFDHYPRVLEKDLAACESAGVSLVFAPSVETMYPDGPDDMLTRLHVDRITTLLCGRARPTHFSGVATAVAKLFNIVPAHVAFFGEKDYQQLVVIRRMVRDLNMPLEVVGCPTVREPDGLAVSSRNAYLSPDERRQAASLSAALFTAAKRVATGERDVAGVVRGIRECILSAGPADIEYVDVVDATTLQALTVIDRPARICLAVEIGSCRLIDNVGVGPG